MKNPFRRRQKLPGAEAEWDQSRHVVLGDGDYVAIPEDQLPPEAVERLTEVALQRSDDGSLAVIVNSTAVEATIHAVGESIGDEMTARLIAEEGEGDLENDSEYRQRMEDAADAAFASPEYQAQMRLATLEAFNNTEHWMKVGLEDIEGDPTYTSMRLDLLTGRIGGDEAMPDLDYHSDEMIEAVQAVFDSGSAPRLAEEWRSLPVDYSTWAEGIETDESDAWAAFIGTWAYGRILRYSEEIRSLADEPIPASLTARLEGLDPHRDARQTVEVILTPVRVGRLSDLSGLHPAVWHAVRAWAIARTHEAFDHEVPIDVGGAFDFGYVMRCFETASVE